MFAFRSGLPRVSLLFASVFLTTTAFAQTNFDDVQITSSKVAGKVYMLMGSGGNIGVTLGDDGVLMVDDQFAPLADKIKAAIRDLGGDAPTFLLNTHWHGDHSGGNEMFADTATIIAHDNVRVRMAAPDSGRVPESLPVLTFGDGLSLYFNDEEIRLIHLPAGHTDGDTAIWFTGSNVLHMGDEFVAIAYPFIDLNSGGSVNGLLSNAEKILALVPDDIMIIPGHGPLSTKADFARWAAGVKTTAGIVTAKIAAGMTLEAIIAEGLPAEYASWGQGFISEQAWITAIYNSTTK
jgi:glyoxylase-like metal-dependent hydrolase (beta-lactamase superfamily II)